VGVLLDGVTVRDVSFVHPVSSPDELWHGLLGGTVRSSAVVRAQAEPVRHRIREAFDRLLEIHRVDSGFELPVSIKLAAARRTAGRPPHTPRSSTALQASTCALKVEPVGSKLGLPDGGTPA
jgi:hypothetical protein